MPQSSPICMHKLYLLQSTVAQFQRALYKVIFVDLRHARLAVVATFATAGFIFSNWAARLPVVKEQLDLSGSGLGILLLFASAGSLTALPLRSEEHTSELQSRGHLVCRLLLEKKKR